MITEKYYTRLNEHPEDRIFRDKEYIRRLQKHIDAVYEQLKYDLCINEFGDEILFDYIFNENDKNVEFTEYLDRFEYGYEDVFEDKRP